MSLMIVTAPGKVISRIGTSRDGDARRLAADGRFRTANDSVGGEHDPCIEANDGAVLDTVAERYFSVERGDDFSGNR